MVISNKRAAGRAPLLLEYAEGEITIRGNRFTLSRFPYLEELYGFGIQPPRLVFMKAAQVGMSTYHLIKAAWLAQVRKAKTLYLLPTEKMALRFGRDRLPSLLGLKRPASPARVTVGDGVVMFRGLINDEGVRAQDADMVVLDELDCAPPGRVTLAQDRVLASDVGWISYLSTPTLPGHGVAKLFDASDQRRWLVKCGRCNWEGDLTENFPSCLTESSRVCPACRRPVDVIRGRWVATAGATEYVGYHVNHLITTMPASEILRQYQAAEDASAVQRFYNSVLGLPYNPPGTSLTDADLERAWGEHDLRATASWSVVGVDVGDRLHAVAATPAQGVLVVIGVATLPSFAEVAAFLRDYGAVRCVVDAMPYKTSAIDLAREFGGKVWLSYFAGTAWTLGVEATPDGVVPKITLERTVALDRMVGALKTGRILLPRPRQKEMQDLVSHVKALSRIVEEGAGGVLKPVWRSAGPDHFAMALAYMLAAADICPPSAPPPAFADQRRF